MEELKVLEFKQCSSISKLFNSCLSIMVQDDKMEVQIGKLNKTVKFGHLKAKVPIYRGTLLIEDVVS